MEIKAINIKQKEYKNKEDFFLSCEVFIGPEKENFVYEVYDFNVISIKKLFREFRNEGVMLNRGWMITKYYDEDKIREKINCIIKECSNDSDEDTYMKIASFLRIQES